MAEAAAPVKGSSPRGVGDSGFSSLVNAKESLGRASNANKPLAPAEAKGTDALWGSYGGFIGGRKKEKSRLKVCMVDIKPEGILVRYQKGPFYNRKEFSEMYPWMPAYAVSREGDRAVLLSLLHFRPSSEGTVKGSKQAIPDHMETEEVLVRIIPQHVVVSKLEAFISDCIEKSDV